MSPSHTPTLSSFALPSKAIEALSTKLDTVHRQLATKQNELVRAKTSLQNCRRRLQYYSEPKPGGSTVAQAELAAHTRMQKDREQWTLRVKEAEGKVAALEGEVQKLGEVKAEVTVSVSLPQPRPVGDV